MVPEIIPSRFCAARLFTPTVAHAAVRQPARALVRRAAEPRGSLRQVVAKSGKPPKLFAQCEASAAKLDVG
jgi:hypothetical protein